MPPAPTSTRAAWSFDAIGVPWTIDTAEALPDAARAAVAAVIARFDAEWSRFRPDSVVSVLGAAGGSVTAPPDAADMLDLYAELSHATDGAVNPLVGGSLESLGYDAAHSFVVRGPVPGPRDWRDRLKWHDGWLTLAGSATVDVGAIGKGRLVDLVLDTLAAWTDDIVVDASGDLAVRGRSERIGLEHPYDPTRAVGVIEITDAALCASAGNRRPWGRGLHQGRDARTGLPVRTVAATWAIAPTALRADAVATALFHDGGPELAAAWGVEWVRMTTTGRAEWSPGSTAELFV